MILPGWKTIAFSLATITLGVLQGTGYTSVVAQNPGVALTTSGIITLLLRLITNQPAAVQISMSPPATPVKTPITTAPTA